MTAAPDIDVTPAPVIDTTVSPPSIHWCCQKVAEPPHISLCGRLLNGQRFPGKVPPCPDCIAEVPAHAAGCGICRAAARHWGVL